MSSFRRIGRDSFRVHRLPMLCSAMDTFRTQKPSSDACQDSITRDSKRSRCCWYIKRNVFQSIVAHSFPTTTSSRAPSLLNPMYMRLAHLFITIGFLATSVIAATVSSSTQALSPRQTYPPWDPDNPPQSCWPSQFYCSEELHDCCSGVCVTLRPNEVFGVERGYDLDPYWFYLVWWS